jgi:ABC-type spermidine/putrescine transport system permease subunit I
MGMRIGAVSGAAGFVASTFWLVFQFAKNSHEFRTVLEEQMEKSIGANPDPRAQDIMRQFMNNLNTPQGLATFFVLILVVMAIAFVVFTAAGGALGAAMFARRRDVR